MVLHQQNYLYLTISDCKEQNIITRHRRNERAEAHLN